MIALSTLAIALFNCVWIICTLIMIALIVKLALTISDEPERLVEHGAPINLTKAQVKGICKLWSVRI